MKRPGWFVAGALVFVLAACGPESARQRGQLGADVQNKTPASGVSAKAGEPQPIIPGSKIFSSKHP
ncbi:MAG: hypothetical protein NVSMB42_25360 [Herpetosiphon sp.]